MEEFISTVEKQYDYIIFDTPPVGVVLDAIPVIAQSDGVVLVVKHNSTMYPELKKTIETLKYSKAKILGIIMNDIEPVDSKKYSKYKKGYGYGYGDYGY
jgi:Mrp family chromosome partitioning ATPase